MDTGVKGCSLHIIVAVAENGVIGKEDNIPWWLNADMKHFALLTKGHMLIMGRKTHESILARNGRMLPGRGTVVITRQKDYEVPEGCIVVSSWEDALKRVQGCGIVYVCGGAEIYTQALPLATRLHVTYVNASPEGDAHFRFNREEWFLDSTQRHEADDRNEHSFAFCTYVRNSPKPAQVSDRRQEGFMMMEHARTSDQYHVMSRIASERVCSFCPEHRGLNDLMPCLRQGRFWSLRPNRWPYENAWLHLLLILERHAENMSDLTAEEWTELHEHLSWIEKKYELSGGAIGIRFGDPRMNGATVDHLHVHLIVADQDTSVPGYQRVRFAMGPKPLAP